jgi:hypothetical protein
MVESIGQVTKGDRATSFETMKPFGQSRTVRKRKIALWVLLRPGNGNLEQSNGILIYVLNKALLRYQERVRRRRMWERDANHRSNHSKLNGFGSNIAFSHEGTKHIFERLE